MRRNSAIIGFALLFLAACALAQPPVTALRGTTIYRIDATLGRAPLADLLTATLPAIKASGFNAVFIPAVWADFDPKPMATPRAYNQAAFNNAVEALAVIRRYGMQALVGLDYIGVGWGPDLGSVAACDWAVNPATYKAFEQYAGHFLSEMMPYADTLRPFVFTEGAEGCGQTGPDQAVAVAARLRGTLGSLPARLPPLVRAAYSVGYHDYSIINLGWGGGASPIAAPNPFDWLSMAVYNVDSEAEIDRRAMRFRALYPMSPLIVAELGASACAPYSAGSQVANLTMGAKYAVAHGMGFNVWGWLNHNPNECNPGYGGLAITDAGGMPGPAAQALRAMLK